MRATPSPAPLPGGLRYVSLLSFLFLAVLMQADAAGQGAAADAAREILDAAGLQGGLIVHLDCNGGELTAGGSRPKETLLVHGLDTEPQDVQLARQHIQQLGLYGPVSVEQLARSGGGRQASCVCPTPTTWST